MLLALLLLVVTPDEQQHRPIELRVQPHICMAPCDVRAQVRIERHELNRWWVIQVDGPGIFQSSAQQLEGDRAAVTQPDIWFKALTPGEYEIITVVYRQQKNSEAGRAVAKVTVTGGMSK